MAKTVDEIAFKVNVDGTANLDQLNTKLNQIQGGVRNTAYQIQDLAVQLSMGTNAFIAIGQQLPQLLSAFGTAGVVIGAVAAVAIPLLQYGLKAAGVDMRNLDEMTKDLTNSTQKYLDAQKQNQSSLSGLANAYGTLTPLAKDFFEVQERLSRTKAIRDSADAVKELQNEYKALSRESVNAARESGRFTPGMGSVAADLGVWWRQFRKGLTEEQGYAIAEMLKEIDGASPEKTVSTINKILNYLDQLGPSASNYRQAFEKTIEPIMKVNEELVKQQLNIKAAAQAASDLQTALLGIQNKFQPDINAAKRNFDQIRAIELEGRLKIAEFEKNINTKTAQDGVDRSRELAAFRLRVEQDVADKIADVRKQQEETARSAGLVADAKGRQLDLEREILKFGEQGKLATLNAVQYQTDLTRATAAYNEELKGIEEQLRKNVITEIQAEELRKKAAENRQRADQLALDSLEARQRALLFNLEQQNKLDERRLALFKETSILSDREKKNAEDIFAIETARLKELEGIKALTDETLKAAKAADINKAYDERIAAAKRQQEADKALMEDFDAGWQKAYANYIENSRNAFETARNLFEKTTRGMEDLIVNFAKTGKFEFKNFLATIAEELLRSNIRRLMAQTLGGGGDGSSILGTLFGGFKSLLGFANGGLIPTNDPVVVGERGPEIISGAAGRYVTPNNQLGQTVVYNINAVDALSFKQMVARDPGFIHAVALQGARTVPGVR
jgi:lambda family phage tail tape measure protein